MFDSYYVQKSSTNDNHTIAPLVVDFSWLSLCDTSHSDTSLNSSLIRIFHRSKFFVGSLFQIFDSLLLLFLGSMSVPTNQHKTFQCVLSSLTLSGNFLEAHSSYNYSKPNILNCEVLNDRLPKSNCILLVQVVPINSFKSFLTIQSLDFSHSSVTRSGCYIHCKRD